MQNPHSLLRYFLVCHTHHFSVFYCFSLLHGLLPWNYLWWCTAIVLTSATCLHPALNIPVKGGSVVPKIASLKQYCVLNKNNEKAIYIFFSVFLTLCHVGQKKSCLYFIEFLIKTVSFLFVTSVYMNGTPWDLPRTDFTYVLSLAFVCS